MIHSTSPSNRPVVPMTDASGKRLNPPPSSPSGSDRVNTANSAQIRAALESQPEIRAEVVERARALASDPAYPPREIIESIARDLLSSPA